MKQIFFLVAFLFFTFFSALGQCSMCKAVVTSASEQGNVELAQGVNSGIMYLMVFPYLLILVVGYFFYKHIVKREF